MFSEITNQAVALLLLRTVAGSLFFFQGYDKLFNVKIENVVRTFNDPLSKFRIPLFLLKPAVAISSLLELICGAMLFMGLFKNIALYLLAGDLILVALIFSNIKPMWDLQYFFPRLIIIVILLFSSMVIDVFSLDYLLGFNMR